MQDLLQLKQDLRDHTYEELGFETGDDRPLVPIRNGVCYACFVRFPTSRLAVFGEKQPATCENCGRLLYQVP